MRWVSRRDAEEITQAHADWEEQLHPARWKAYQRTSPERTHTAAICASQSCQLHNGPDDDARKRGEGGCRRVKGPCNVLTENGIGW